MNRERSARPVTPEDDDFLFRVYASTRAEEFAAFGWPPQQQEMLLRMQYRARTGSYSATYPEAEHSLLCEDGTAVGAIIVSRTAKELRLVDIAFLPEHRNRGYGAREVSKLIRQAASLGLPLRLSVRRDNPALRLYLRLNFIAIGGDAMYIEMEYPSGDPVVDDTSA